MAKIIRVSKRHISQLARIDFESQYPATKKLKLNLNMQKKEITQRFSKKNELIFAYKKGSQIIGYASLKKDFPGYKHAELFWLAVRKQYQRQGVGSTLLTHIEKLAKKQGYRAIFLYTGKPMLSAQEFYKSQGYSLVNEFNNYYSEDYAKASGSSTAVLYMKRL